MAAALIFIYLYTLYLLKENIDTIIFPTRYSNH